MPMTCAKADADERPGVKRRLADPLLIEQAVTVARRGRIVTIGSILACLVVETSYWPTAPHRYLAGFMAALFGAHAVSILRSVWMTRSPDRIWVGTRVSGTIIAAIIALTWASVPVVLTPISDGRHGDMLTFVGAGLITCSVLLAPLLSVALVFAGINALGLLVAAVIADGGMIGHHSLLILIYAGVTTMVVIHQSRDFARRVRNELTVLDQGEIIGMLLRDFEESASDWLWQTDGDLKLRRVSDRLADLLGHDRTMLQGASLRAWIKRGLRESDDVGDAVALLAALDNHAPFRDLKVHITAGREARWFSLTGKPVFDRNNGFAGYRGVGSDITAMRLYDERLEYLAQYDSLTSLPNRTRFREALSRACQANRPLSLLLLDLDGFRAVNDTLGHQVGDALLVAVAERLRACLGNADIAARLGGDEFAILLASSDRPGAERLASRLIASVSAPFRLDTVTASIGLSIGIVFPDDASLDPEHLLKGADLALYRSKAEGRGTWHVFTPSMAARAQERQAMLTDLRHAIGHDELVLDFQPIVDVISREVTGAEALVRWNHPVKGRIPPCEFIPLAEASGLILPLGAWVLRQACEAANHWEKKARIAVNLSPAQFRDPGLLSLIDEVLASTGLSPERLELEITESVFLDAVDATVACLNELRARGIHIALDDFGTGYSSLSYLRSFPFDKVKIDQSFIRDLGTRKDTITIVQAIVGMADSLGMRTTGEGVETALQAEILQRTGCSQIQGYLFGRPCSAKLIAGIMRTRTSQKRSRLAETLA